MGLGMFQRRLVSGLANPQSLGSHSHAAPVQGFHDNGEPGPYSTQNLGRGNRAVSKNKLGRGHPTLPHLLVSRAECHTWHISLDDENRDALVAGGAVCHRRNQQKVRVGPVDHEVGGPVQYKLLAAVRFSISVDISFRFNGRLQDIRPGPRVRLGQRATAQLVPRRSRGQIRCFCSAVPTWPRVRKTARCWPP